jgi:transposase-like protein
MLSPPSVEFDISDLLRNGFDESVARELYACGEEVVVWVMLQLAVLAQGTGSSSCVVPPSTPSGAIPVYQKEPSKKRCRKSGAKPGHSGSHRPPPEKITRQEHHRAEYCPDCGGVLRPRRQVRQRYIEDLPEHNTPEVVEHLIHQAYCPRCKKIVEPVVPDAMPGAILGHRTVVFSAFLHYFIGIPILKIISIFNVLFYFKLTSGGLIDLWHRLAQLLKPWYEEIAESARNSSVLHADETGWRVNGKTCWMWCFTNQETTYYVIDKSRGSPVVKRFFKRVFNGILITDFFGAYNAVVCAGKQKCLVHLLRDLKSVTKKYRDNNRDSSDWGVFAKRLKRILRDAMRLCGKRSEMATEEFERLRNRIELRLSRLIQGQGKTPETIDLFANHKNYEKTRTGLFRKGTHASRVHPQS